ncbi:DUF2345 domain-containing protein, partial [Neisseria sp. HMSC065D04]|uniref:DUF2345 domain-containing protein n=1 Tax=Neisseria sp. HMSC065D04 TaxID=1739542 RepID=UPI000B336EB2
DELQLNALKDATLTSSAGKITIAAKEEILITCKGAYIKLANGEVEIGSPKLVRVKAPMEVTGPNSRTFNMPLLNPKDLFSLAFELIDEKTGRKITNRPFVIIDETDSNKVIIGKTNKYGRTGMNKHLIRNSAKVRFLEQLEIAVLKED